MKRLIAVMAIALVASIASATAGEEAADKAAQAVQDAIDNSKVHQGLQTTEQRKEAAQAIFGSEPLRWGGKRIQIVINGDYRRLHTPDRGPLTINENGDLIKEPNIETVVGHIKDYIPDFDMEILKDDSAEFKKIYN